MVIVVKDGDGKIYLISKGADSVLINKVKQSQRYLLQEISEDISREGYRTLVYCVK